MPWSSRERSANQASTSRRVGLDMAYVDVELLAGANNSPKLVPVRRFANSCSKSCGVTFSGLHEKRTWQIRLTSEGWSLGGTKGRNIGKYIPLKGS